MIRDRTSTYTSTHHTSRASVCARALSPESAKVRIHRCSLITAHRVPMLPHSVASITDKYQHRALAGAARARTDAVRIESWRRRKDRRVTPVTAAVTAITAYPRLAGHGFVAPAPCSSAPSFLCLRRRRRRRTCLSRAECLCVRSGSHMEVRDEADTFYVVMPVSRYKLEQN